MHIGNICARKMCDCHRVKVWEQGKSIESGCGSKGNPSSQDVGAGIAIESRCGSKGNPSSQDVGAREIHRVRIWEQGIVIESRFGSKENTHRVRRMQQGAIK